MNDHDLLIKISNDVGWMKDKLGGVCKSLGTKADKDDFDSLSGRVDNLKVASMIVSAVVSIPTTIITTFLGFQKR